MGVHIQPSLMPYQASKEGGRSGHGRKLRSGTADPVAVVQPQCSQRHAEPLARTWKRRFRVHPPPMSDGHSRISVGPRRRALYGCRDLGLDDTA